MFGQPAKNAGEEYLLAEGGLVPVGGREALHGVARGVDESAQALLALEVRGVLVLGVGCGHDAVDVLSAVNDRDSLLSQQLALLITSVDSCC